MEKNLGYLAVSAEIAAGIAGAAGISHCLNQKRFIKVLPAREKSEILEGTEKVSVRASYYMPNRVDVNMLKAEFERFCHLLYA